MSGEIKKNSTPRPTSSHRARRPRRRPGRRRVREDVIGEKLILERRAHARRFCSSHYPEAKRRRCSSSARNTAAVTSTVKQKAGHQGGMLDVRWKLPCKASKTPCAASPATTSHRLLVNPSTAIAANTHMTTAS